MGARNGVGKGSLARCVLSVCVWRKGAGGPFLPLCVWRGSRVAHKGWGSQARAGARVVCRPRRLPPCCACVVRVRARAYESALPANGAEEVFRTPARAHTQTLANKKRGRGAAKRRAVRCSPARAASRRQQRGRAGGGGGSKKTSLLPPATRPPPCLAAKGPRAARVERCQ